MLRVGLIGAGWHSLLHHAPALLWCARLPEFRGRVELTALCDVDLPKAQKAAAEFGFGAACGSIDELVTRVDAVVAILPTHAMAGAVERIGAGGLPMLIEKPVGADFKEFELIARLVHRRPHMVSLNRRFDPAVRRAIEWLRGKRVRSVDAIMSRARRTEGDFVWSTGVHMADLLCHLVGPLHAVNAAGVSNWRVATMEGDRVWATVRFTPTGGRIEEVVRLAGDGFEAEVRTGTHGPWRVRAWQDGKLVLDETSPDGVEEFERNGTGEETAAFLRAVLGTGRYWPRIDDVRAGSELAWSVQELKEGAI